MNFLKMRQLYNDGKLSKQDFIDNIHYSHMLLNDYAKYIENTEIKKIVISAQEVYIVTLDDLIMHCDFVDKRCVPLYILSFGEYEKKECHFILSLIETDDVVLDIGANHGWYSLNIAKKFPNTKIYAFEPVKKVLDIMAENVRVNNLNNINIFNIGIGNENSIREFNYNKDMSGATSMVNILDRNDVEKINCDVRTLDSFIIEHKIDKVDFIKCDIEGAELFALQGACNILEKYRPKLFIEMLRKWSARFNYHPNDIICFMAGLGYKCFELSNGYLSCLGEMTDDTKGTNFFFLHSKKHESQTHGKITRIL
jgi:FkbM family methyltransferase